MDARDDEWAAKLAKNRLEPRFSYLRRTRGSEKGPLVLSAWYPFGCRPHRIVHEQSYLRMITLTVPTLLLLS